jgi:peroxiredoxin Q/BCP
MPAKLKAGDKAPDFTAAIIGGEYSAPATVTLSQVRDRPVVVYFYPKDDTPGCTTQACGIRDEWSALKKKCHLFGVSIDPIKKHEKFITKFSLPFPLISDEDRKIAEAYGVWVEKSLYGKKYMGTERSTFVIGTDGRIKAVLEKVKPAEHVKMVLEALK